MRTKFRMHIIVKMIVLFGIIFLVMHLRLFPTAISLTRTPGVYLLSFVTGLIFFVISFHFLIKYGLKGSQQEEFKALELVASYVQLISIIFLFLHTIKISVAFLIAIYLGYLLILLGAIGYYKNKGTINIAFLAWGFFIVLWRTNFYSSMY